MFANTYGREGIICTHARATGGKKKGKRKKAGMSIKEAMR